MHLLTASVSHQS